MKQCVTGSAIYLQEVQICVSIMEMFAMLPASTFRLAEQLAALLTKGEKALGLEVSYIHYVCLFVRPSVCLHVSLVYVTLVILTCIYTSQIGSPFRMPFFKFLVKFPPEAVDFFLTRLSDPEMSRLFYVSILIVTMYDNCFIAYNVSQFHNGVVCLQILLKKPMSDCIRLTMKTFSTRLIHITFVPQLVRI